MKSRSFVIGDVPIQFISKAGVRNMYCFLHSSVAGGAHRRPHLIQRAKRRGTLSSGSAGINVEVVSMAAQFTLRTPDA
eukprot:11788915-Alexandrium_andersonii.AAC.1